jgi:hypothetical protein
LLGSALFGDKRVAVLDEPPMECEEDLGFQLHMGEKYGRAEEYGAFTSSGSAFQDTPGHV